MRDAHALAAAAGGGLDHHRIADLVGDRGRVLGRFDHAEVARHGRHLGGVGEFLRFDLVAHRLDGADVGTDEHDPRVGERLGEGRSLGQEAVARMDRLGARLLAGRDDLVDDEVALRSGGRADQDGLVGHFDMKGVLVRLRVDRDGLYPHLARSLHDPAGDLASVGDQNLFEHGFPVRRRLGFSLGGRSIGCAPTRKRRAPSQGLAKGMISGANVPLGRERLSPPAPEAPPRPPAIGPPAPEPRRRTIGARGAPRRAR